MKTITTNELIKALENKAQEHLTCYQTKTKKDGSPLAGYRRHKQYYNDTMKFIDFIKFHYCDCTFNGWKNDNYGVYAEQLCKKFYLGNKRINMNFQTSGKVDTYLLLNGKKVKFEIKSEIKNRCTPITKISKLIFITLDGVFYLDEKEVEQATNNSKHIINKADILAGLYGTEISSKEELANLI